MFSWRMPPERHYYIFSSCQSLSKEIFVVNGVFVLCQVKLANQESELVGLLKRIPLGHDELKIIRERAHQLREGTLKSRGEALLPINLAGFLLDALINSSGTPSSLLSIYAMTIVDFGV